jgi:hypothetical protein
MWSGCISGALEKSEYKESLAAASCLARPPNTSSVVQPRTSDGNAGDALTRGADVVAAEFEDRR